MQVWKFGGTSVGKPERMHSIRNLITEDSTRKIVVLSALYETFIKELYKTPAGYAEGKAIIDKEFSFIRSLVSIKPFSVKQEKEIVAEGELLSTQMFEAYLREEGVNAV